jgi:hypothetical protein
MPNNTQEQQLELDEFDDDDFNENDFGFIISENGELKSVMYPEKLLEDPPQEIKEILRIFGIDDINEIEHRTLH